MRLLKDNKTHDADEINNETLVNDDGKQMRRTQAIVDDATLKMLKPPQRSDEEIKSSDYGNERSASKKGRMSKNLDQDAYQVVEVSESEMIIYQYTSIRLENVLNVTKLFQKNNNNITKHVKLRTKL